MQPPFGFAYQFRPKTIVRGGYGIFKASIGVNYSNTDQTGSSQSTQMVPTRDNGITYVATNASPLPDGLVKPAASRGHRGCSTVPGPAVLNGIYSNNPQPDRMRRWQ